MTSLCGSRAVQQEHKPEVDGLKPAPAGSDIRKSSL